MKISVISVALLLLLSTGALAWSGYDSDKGNFVDIDKGNLVRRGETIEIFDGDDGRFKDVEVESIRRFGNTVEVEVYDPEKGENRTFEMDDF